LLHLTFIKSVQPAGGSTLATILTAFKPKLIQLNEDVHAKQFFLAHFQSSCEKWLL